MNVTLRPARGERLDDLVRAVSAHGSVRSGRGGVEVDEQTALAYLTARHNSPDTPPARPLLMVPAGVAAHVAAVEDSGGLRRPVDDEQPPPATKKTATARLRAKQPTGATP